MTRPAWIVIGAFGLAIALWVGVNMSSGNRGQEASPGVSLEEAFTRARAERKCVLVDVYTDWCSWCKKMDRETYTNTQVRAMLEKEFLVVKLNAESDAELTFNGSRMTMVEFAQQAGVTGYPTTLFFDSNGRKVVSLPGYMDAPRFARVLDYVSAARYRTTPLDEYLAREI